MSAVFASSSDAPRGRPPGGEVFTFYSYKGGTGRSMLLANVAWQLASAGCKVLIMDWDLEAPGLHRYFKPFLRGDTELREQEGVIEWLTDYWDACLDEPSLSVEALVTRYADPRHYVRKLDVGNYLSGGLDLMCAGRQDKQYAGAVADFDFTRLYQKLRGEAFIETAKRILVGPGGYDYVLVDSRTGVSDTSGFCTVALADTLVVCYTYNNQSVIGASQIARDIKRQAELRRQAQVNSGEARRFRLFAVPSRVDDLAPERLERRQKHAWALFSDLLTDVAPQQQPAYWLSVQIRNHGQFAYEEVLAACMNRPNDQQSVLGAVTHLTRVLTDDAFTEMSALSDEQRQALREQFGTLGDLTPVHPQYEAWDQFMQRLPEPGAQESILQGCFPLLIQLFTYTATPPTSAGPSACIVRSMLLESELTADERRMAEMLTSLGITQRQITDDRQRGLRIADESVFANWEGLRSRVTEQQNFLVMREQIRQARRSWEANGRSITALRSLQGDFAAFMPSDEQRAWMGRPNLQMLQTLQDVQAMHQYEFELKDQLRRLGESSRVQIESLQTKQVELEVRHANHVQALHVQHLKADRTAVWLRVAIISSCVVIVTLASGAYYLLDRVNRDRATLNARLASQKSQIAQLQGEVLSGKGEAALRFYGEGVRQVLRAGKGTGKDHDAQLRAAVQAFSSAIVADPGFPEAYRARAATRAKLMPRDVLSEFMDWSRYYDLRLSLYGRVDLVIRGLGDGVDKKLVLDQLMKLRAEANLPAAQTEVSARDAAARLEGALKQFPPGLQRSAMDTVNVLNQVQDYQDDNKSAKAP